MASTRADLVRHVTDAIPESAVLGVRTHPPRLLARDYALPFGANYTLPSFSGCDSWRSHASVMTASVTTLASCNTWRLHAWGGSPSTLLVNDDDHQLISIRLYSAVRLPCLACFQTGKACQQTKPRRWLGFDQYSMNV
jgi:hypothetical protein